MKALARTSDHEYPGRGDGISELSKIVFVGFGTTIALSNRKCFTLFVGQVAKENREGGPFLLGSDFHCSSQSRLGANERCDERVLSQALNIFRRGQLRSVSLCGDEA